MLSLFFIVLVVLVVVAYFYTDEKYGLTSPSVVIRQVAHWLTFGLLFSVDVSKLSVAAWKNADATFKLTQAESGTAVDLGVAHAKAEYKSSDVRRSLVEATKSLHDDTKAKRAKAASYSAL